MTTISPAEPWTYRTPEMTVTYPAGDHDVSDDIAAAFAARELKEEDDGNGIAEAGASGAASEAED